MTHEAPSETSTETRKVWAEDVEIGTTTDLGTYDLTARSIVEFGRQWDPLPMHTDEELAKNSGFGRLIASGIQSIGIAQRLLVQNLYGGWQIYAGRRLVDVRFLRPVAAGDRLHGYATIESVDLTRADRCLVTARDRLEVEGHPVLTMDVEFYMLHDPARATVNPASRD